MGNATERKPLALSISDTGPKKSFGQQKEDSLEGLNEEAEIRRKALERRKNLAFSEDTKLQKERARLYLISRKVVVRLKRRGQLNERLDWTFG